MQFQLELAVNKTGAELSTLGMGICVSHTEHCITTKQASLKLKTCLKQILDYLPFAFALPVARTINM